MAARFHHVLPISLALPTAASIMTWMPDAATMWKDLSHKADGDAHLMENELNSWNGMKFRYKPENWDTHWFDASFWPSWTSRNWVIPLTAVTCYFIAIPVLKWIVEFRGKFNVRNFAFYWNLGLSIFSWFGVFACVPVLVGSFQEYGLYFTCCAPAVWYGTGTSGFFVALFIYSKIAELMDTVLLLLAQKPVIALQWWHHSTVLLYCWHSFTCRIATGLWFAAMNYSVHSVMYGYFALVATPYRKYVTPFAIFITLAQLAQMLVGMFVTIKAVMYQSAGLNCNVNKTNSMLGLLMYASYFVLFFKLFIDNYVTQTRKRATGLPPKKKTMADVTFDISRKITASIVPQMEFDDDGENEQAGKKKKRN